MMILRFIFKSIHCLAPIRVEWRFVHKIGIGVGIHAWEYMYVTSKLKCLENEQPRKEPEVTVIKKNLVGSKTRQVELVLMSKPFFSSRPSFSLTLINIIMYRALTEW